jgi:predicted TIM-barrel fold metal-dependent hydrolase
MASQTSLESVHDKSIRSAEHIGMFLPEPEPTERRYAIISADDHYLEPPTLFDGRLATKFVDAAPRVVDGEDGGQYWLIDGALSPIRDWNVASGRASKDWTGAAARFEELRPGGWDVDARVRDMDLAGIELSLNFPSAMWGFAGRVFSAMKDRDLGFACLRAYNDWVIDEWCAAHPGRFIPCQLPWFLDPQVAADEIRLNAARGFTSVSFSENPEALGYPSIHSGYWEPFLAACAETDTVINLHVGSSSIISQPSSDSPHGVPNALFGMNSMLATTDWLFSRIPLRYPNIKIVLSESGIGWVPGLIDRLEWTDSYRDSPIMNEHWNIDVDGPTIDVLKRNFWFTSIWDPATFRVLDLIGADRVMLEVDYPHPDSSWPHCQARAEAQLGHLDRESIEAVTHTNAEQVYRCRTV